MKLQFRVTLAAIALAQLCIFSRLNALTVTQTFALDLTGATSGQMTYNVSRVIPYVGFDPALGLLQSVDFHAEMSAYISTTDFNFGPPNGAPAPTITVTPFVGIEAQLATSDMNVGTTKRTTIVYGPAKTLTSNQSISFSAPASLSVTETFTDSVSLANFSGAKSPHIAFLQGDVFGSPYYWGGVVGVGNGNFTISYNYASTPDAGSSAGVFAIALVSLLAANHRLKSRTRLGA